MGEDVETSSKTQTITTKLPELPKKGNYRKLEIPFSSKGLPETDLETALVATTEQIVFIQDFHEDARIRHALNYSTAQKLFALGFRQYLVEAPSPKQELFDQLGRGKTVNLYGVPLIGPQSYGDKSFADAVYAMSGAGMRVKAIDHPGIASKDIIKRPTKNEKEIFIFERIKEALQQDGKIMVLIGGLHAELGDIDGVKSTVQRLVDEGVDVLSVRLGRREQRKNEFIPTP